MSASIQGTMGDSLFSPSSGLLGFDFCRLQSQPGSLHSRGSMTLEPFGHFLCTAAGFKYPMLATSDTGHHQGAQGQMDVRVAMHRGCPDAQKGAETGGVGLGDGLGTTEDIVLGRVNEAERWISTGNSGEEDARARSCDILSPSRCGVHTEELDSTGFMFQGWGCGNCLPG